MSGDCDTNEPDAAELPDVSPEALELLTPRQRQVIDRMRRRARVSRPDAPKRVPRSELPLCGLPTHRWVDGGCERCGDREARHGRACPTCKLMQPPGAPCRARVTRDPDGQPRKRCRVHGGTLYGPKTPEGRARSTANLWRGWPPGERERRAAEAKRRSE